MPQGNDQVEEAQVRVHVEREAVRSDGAGDVNADGCDLGLRGEHGGTDAFVRLVFLRLVSVRPVLVRSADEGVRRSMSRVRPHARQSWHSLGRNREIGAGADQNFFEPSHEFDSAKTFSQGGRRVCRSTGESSKVEDWVADDLSGAVKGNVAAAIAFVKLDATLGQEFGRCNHIGSFRIAPESNDGGVFQQQQHVADLLRFSQFNQLLLQAQASGVVNGAELDERDQDFPTSNVQLPISNCRFG